MRNIRKRILAALAVLVLCVTLAVPCAMAASGYDPDGWTDGIVHTHNYAGGKVSVYPNCTTAGYIGTRCAGCSSVRKDMILPALGHDYAGGKCDRCNSINPKFAAGDITGDAVTDNSDVVYLLWHTLFPNDYPLDLKVDYTGDGETTNEDVVCLLWHTLFPEEFPL